MDDVVREPPKLDVAVEYGGFALAQVVVDVLVAGDVVMVDGGFGRSAIGGDAMSALGMIGAAVNVVDHVVENLNVTAGDAHVDAGGKRAAVVFASKVAQLEILDSDVAAVLDLEQADGGAVVASESIPLPRSTIACVRLGSSGK